MDFFFFSRVFPCFGLFDSPSIFLFLPPRKEKKLQNMFIMVLQKFLGACIAN